MCCNLHHSTSYKSHISTVNMAVAWMQCSADGFLWKAYFFCRAWRRVLTECRGCFSFVVVEGGRINRHIAQKLFTFDQIYLYVCWSIVQIGNVWSHSLPACVQLQSTQPYRNPSLTLNSARLSCVFTKLSSIFKPCLYCITVTDLHFG